MPVYTYNIYITCNTIDPIKYKSKWSIENMSSYSGVINIISNKEAKNKLMSRTKGYVS